LETAWSILVNAGVFLAYNESDGKPAPQALPHLTLGMNGGRLEIVVDKTPEPDRVDWTGEELPPVDGLIQALAYALATIFNTPPHSGPLDWPWSKNVVTKR
jgi:hypothetical protein